jgi:signal peptidase I
MKSSSRRTMVFLAVLVIMLLIFSYFVLTYTRRVSGTSMLPTLEDGDLVVIQTVPQNSVSLGTWSSMAHPVRRMGKP